jgi:hypothetical protein
MAWAFDIKIPGFPEVLAGPILRKVTSTSVTVWFALKRPGNVKLTVYNGTTAVLYGERQASAVGKNLYIVAVTANKPPPNTPSVTALQEGIIYEYDVTFDFPAATGLPAALGMSLADATKGKDATSKPPELAYFPYTRPSFCLPPSDLNKLRMLHGSCRHPNANGEKERDTFGGFDALDILHSLIEETATHPDLRPHQLLMTGDQIYADDVAGHLLMALTAASDLLLGWQETLPLPVMHFDNTGFALPNNGPRPANRAPPYTRHWPSWKIGLTSDVPHNHLFSLGEYICMYLFVWADAVWPSALPTAVDLTAAALTDPLASKAAMKRYVGEEIVAVEKFKKTLPNVRRAMANIPTYMIMDDHDVTDDFNMERSFFTTVYSNDMGKRVVQNGLTAYALCQHWGNVPESFEPNSTQPGQKLLQALAGCSDANYTARSADIMRWVGVHDLTAMKAFSAAATNRSKGVAVFHDADSLTYDYTIEGPSHQVIVTDTRTWRLMPDGRVTPQLLPKDQVERQVRNATPPTTIPAAGTKPAVDRLLFVVVTTNAPPVRGIRFAGDHGDTTRFVTEHILPGPPDFHPDVYEAWELPSDPLDRLIKAISDRLPTVNDNGVPTKRGSAVLLSGDVHHGFSSRLLFTATSRFEDSTAQAAKVVVAQMVASSFRNQVSKSLSLHHDGYNYQGWLVGKTVVKGKSQPEGYLGWNIAAGKSKDVSKRMIDLGPDFGASFEYTNTISDPGSHKVSEIGMDATILVKPDYAYRLDYLIANNRFVNGFGLYKVPATSPNPTASQRAVSAQIFKQISGNYRTYNKHSTATREIVGLNNIGEVNVQWGDADSKKVLHTVRWFDWNDIITVDGVSQPKTILTTYEVSLNPADPAFPLSQVLPAGGVP